MQRLLKEDLEVKPYKVTKLQLLSDTTKKKRLEKGWVLLKKLLDGTQPKFCGLMRSCSPFKTFLMHKTIAYGWKTKIQSLLSSELHSGDKNLLQ